MNVTNVLTVIGGCLLILSIILFFTTLLIQNQLSNKTRFNKLLHNTIPIMGMIGLLYIVLAMLLMGIMSIFGKQLTQFWEWLPNPFKDTLFIIGCSLFLTGTGILINKFKGVK